MLSQWFSFMRGMTWFICSLWVDSVSSAAVDWVTIANWCFVGLGFKREGCFLQRTYSQGNSWCCTRAWWIVIPWRLAATLQHFWWTNKDFLPWDKCLGNASKWTGNHCTTGIEHTRGIWHPRLEIMKTYSSRNKNLTLEEVQIFYHRICFNSAWL